MSGDDTAPFEKGRGRFSGPIPKVALVLASLLLLGCFLEAALRIFSFFDPAPKGFPRKAYDIEGLSKLESFRDLWAPNVDGYYAWVPYETNSHGFQGREYTFEKPANVHRTVVGGDSIAMGQGVLARETYAALVEHALNAVEDREIDFEILNLGVAGFNSTNVADRFRDLGIKFSPDLFVYAFHPNDLWHLPGHRHTRKLNHRPGKSFYRPSRSSSLFIRTLAKRWDRFRDLLYPEKTSYAYEMDENYFRNPETWGALLNDLERMKMMAESRGGRMVLFLYMGLDPNQRFAVDARHFARLEKAAAEQGIPVIRSNTYFTADIEPGSLQITPLDRHPNAKGHLLLARGLVDGLGALPKTHRPPIDVEAVQRALAPGSSRGIPRLLLERSRRRTHESVLRPPGRDRRLSRRLVRPRNGPTRATSPKPTSQTSR